MYSLHLPKFEPMHCTLTNLFSRFWGCETPKKVVFLGVLTFALLGCFQTTSLAQNAVVGTAFAGGWDQNNAAHRICFSDGAGGTRVATLTPNGTGNQFFRLLTCWDGNFNQWGPNTANDYEVLNNTPVPSSFVVQHATAKAYFVNVTSTSHRYVFKTRGGGNPPSNPNFVTFRVEGAVHSVSSVSRSPSSVFPGQEVTVTATLSNNFNNGQAVYLRYTTNNYASSTIVAMTGTGTSRTATIPASANAAGANLSYYVLTSGSGLTIAHADADFFTINLNNNSNSNYNYTVAANWTTTADGNWNAAATWIANAVPANNQPIVINHNVSLTANASASTVTINAGRSLSLNNRTLTIANGGSLTNNGTFNGGTGRVTFNGSGTVTGTITFNDVTINGGVNFGANSTLNGTLILRPGSFVNTNSPTYAVGSTLRYEITGDYGRGNEWTNARTPHHVEIAGTTSLRLGANGGNSIARTVNGNLTIEAGATLRTNDAAAPTPVLANPATWGSNMTASLNVKGNVDVQGSLILSHLFGGDIRLEGNWNRSFASTFTPNKRAVFFEGGNAQNISLGDGSGTELFDYILINKSGGSAILQTNLTCDATALNAFEINGNGNLLDLNGRTLAFTGDGGTFVSNGDNTIISTSGTGTLLINGNKSLNTDTLVSQTPLRIGANVDFQINTGREFNLSTRSLIINGNISGDGVLVAGPTSNLIIGGTGSFSALNVKEVAGEKALGGLTINRIGLVTIGDIDLKGNLFVAPGASISNNGNPMRLNNDTMIQFISGGGTIAHLIINKAATPVVMAGNLTITDTLSMIRGNIQIADNVLGLNGTFLPDTNKLVTTAQSGVSIGGSGATFVMPNNVFASTPVLDLLTVNRPNGLTWNNQALTVAGQLNLQNGHLSWGNNTLTLNGNVSGSGFLRGSSASSLIIGGTGSFGSIQFEAGHRTLDELTVNRASQTMQLNSPLTVNKLVTANGLLDAGSNLVTLLDELQENSGSYVIGSVSKTMQIDGNSLINTKNSFFINPNNNDLGSTQILVTSGPAAIVSVNTNEGIARRVTISPAMQPNSPVDITIVWPSALDNGKDVANALLYRSPDGNTPWEKVSALPIDATGSAGMRALTTAVGGFSVLYVSDENAPLPVRLVNFTANAIHKKVVLNWVTASETNNSHFVIQHSTNGRTFQDVGRVAGNGTSNSRNMYSFEHHAPANGLNYYRLAQHDFDGTINLSQQVVVRLGLRDIVVYPNPVRDRLFLGNADQLRVAQVFDLQGKMHLNLVLSDANNELDFSKLADGVYMLLLVDEHGNAAYHRIVKQ